MAWKKGESGNRHGRPPHPIAERFRQAVDPHLDEVIDSVIQAAKMGDTTAAKLVLERIIPPFKAAQQPAAFQLEGNSLTEKAQAVLAAAASGGLSVQDATALVAAIGSLARLTEIDELEKRVRALEEK